MGLGPTCLLGRQVIFQERESLRNQVCNKPILAPVSRFSRTGSSTVVGVYSQATSPLPLGLIWEEGIWSLLANF